MPLKCIALEVLLFSPSMIFGHTGGESSECMSSAPGGHWSEKTIIISPLKSKWNSSLWLGHTGMGHLSEQRDKHLHYFLWHFTVGRSACNRTFSKRKKWIILIFINAAKGNTPLVKQRLSWEKRRKKSFVGD